MEQELLDEILKDTYTLGDLKKRFLGLKLELQKKIYGVTEATEATKETNEEAKTDSKEPKKSDESKESEGTEATKVTKATDDTVHPSDGGEATKETKAETRPTISEETAKWVENFNPEMKAKIDGKNFSEICVFIEDVINKGSNLTIFFVFVPDQSQLEGFGKWLREHLKNPQLLFNVKIDPSLIGGCAISYKGVYKDYSLKAKIAANKGNLMEEFREYLRR